MTLRLETSQVSEQAAEYGIVDSLARSPFFRRRPDSAFDAATLLDVSETTAFIKATQPMQWAKLSKQFAGEEDAALAEHLTTLIQKRGTLEVLRNGVSFNGINLLLAYFRPAAGGNPEHQARYEGNRFTVMRQVHFSTKTPDQSIDVVILLIPICVQDDFNVYNRLYPYMNILKGEQTDNGQNRKVYGKDHRNGSTLC